MRFFGAGELPCSRVRGEVVTKRKAAEMLHVPYGV
jgi:hypothetical protein